ncbi:MAG: glycosyltransferase family 4 protein [Anaerolineae bacterium]
MRVLVQSWEYPPHIVGGLGRHVADLLPALARRGLEIHLVTPRRDPLLPPYEHANGLHIHRADIPQGHYGDIYEESMAVCASLCEVSAGIMERHAPVDLIHNHDWLTASAAAVLKHQFKVPLVATIHATERGRGRGELGSTMAYRINDAEWRLAYEAWRVICCTKYMANEIVSYLNTPANKIDVIPNGVDVTPFTALDMHDLTAFRARFALPEEKLVVSVGRLVEEKGMQVLVRAAPEVLAAVPEAKFVIAGKGPQADYLARLVRELHLDGKVLLVGFISDEDRNRLYKTADCAVFPSLYEPFGIVALEAMAAKVPVVVSEIGGLREIVQHAETGITVYPNNPASCAWGIIHTLQHPQWAAQRVDNAYKLVTTRYNWDTIAEQTEAVYARVIAERQRTPW